MSIPEPLMSDRNLIVVKKYSNRRLYDTTRSRHITLDELARLVSEGATVKVIDASQGTDLTRQVLTQAILEQGSPLALIPVEMLHAILRYQGTVYQAAFSSFLGMVMKQFLSTGTMWERQVSKMLSKIGGAGDASPPLAPPGSTDALHDDLDGDAVEPGDIQDTRRQLKGLLHRLGRG